MSNTQARSETATGTARARRVDMKLEIVVIPVSDIDRAKRFYGGLDWRLDADFAAGDDFRVIQFTPPGSGCSVIFGKNVTAAAPGSAQGLYLIVSDMKAARDELVGRASRSARCSTTPATCTPARTSPTCSGGSGLAVRIPSIAAIARTPRSAIRTAMAGCSRRSPCDCPDAWTRTTRHSPRQLSSRPRSDVRRLRMASTRCGPGSEMRTGPTGTPSTSSGSKPASRCRHERRLRPHRPRRRLAAPGGERAHRTGVRGGRPQRICPIRLELGGHFVTGRPHYPREES